MKDTLFPRFTHVTLVTAKSKEQATALGFNGAFSICFGPGDDTAICQIHLAETDSGRRPTYKLPEILITEKGRTVRRPVFKGKIRDEIIAHVNHARDMIKATYGKIGYGYTYTVAGTKVTREPEETKAEA
jgi:hypothetical protein